MSYSIRLEKGLRAKIASWSIPTHLLNEILEQLYEVLAESPHQHLVSVPKQRDPLLFSFVSLAQGDPPRDYLFEFHVRYHSDEVTLILSDADSISLEPGPG